VRGHVVTWHKTANRSATIGHGRAIATGLIHALAAINVGDELFIDYGLVIDGEITDDVWTQYACHCGASGCRQSMIGATRMTFSKARRGANAPSDGWSSA
jgi:hypothetical protein